MVHYLGFFINHKLDWAPHVDVVCNRACASLKALQVLGNSQRGLSTANWRLVFNAVCLPVLSYRCQLWANSPKYSSLVKKIQLVLNEGCKVIAGAFWTCPQEPLHKLLHVLPACFYLDKLTQTSTLRLYCVPQTSQILVQLGPDWGRPVQNSPHSGNRGVVNFSTGTGSGQPQQRPTALEALSSRVSCDGPWADVLAVPPWEVPNWGRQLVHQGVMNPQDRRRFVGDLYQSPAYSNMSIICVAGTISNKDQPDNQMVGGAAAILTERGHTQHRGAWG